MKIYIVDDDITVVKMLENIIEDCDLGKVCGYSLDCSACIEEISVLSPDIVLIDLLMPGRDGISVVKELKAANDNLKFIMISQVSSKDLISKAYMAGIDFFINKPINMIEVKTVINNISEKIKFEKTFKNIKSMFLNDDEHEKPIRSENSMGIKIKKYSLFLTSWE